MTKGQAPRCSACGQVILHQRAGVALTPRRAQVFDLIAKAQDGISVDALAARVGTSRANVKVVVAELNAILTRETFLRIIHGKGVGYQLYKIYDRLDSSDAASEPRLVSSQR